MERKLVGFAVIAVVVLGLGGYLLLSPTDERRSPRQGDCTGVRLDAGEDIAMAMADNPPGTTLCLAPGRYEVPRDLRPKSGQRLIGAGLDRTSLVGTGAFIMIDAKKSNASNFLLAHVAISESRAKPGCKACGSGFRGGIDNIIESVRFHDHPNHGVGGNLGGLLVRNSIIDHNGDERFLGCCAGGIKGGNGFTIRDSEVFSNVGVGVWCDVGCHGGMEALDNHIYDNTRDGIRYEISDGGAVISGNLVERNNTSNAVGGHGGITSVGSSHALIRDNILRNNGTAGIVVIKGGRADVVQDVRVVGNQLNGDSLEGCDRPGVSCEEE